MKCALASMGFINENIQYNKNVIIETMVKCSNEADIVIFGEAFLQGFYGPTFEIEHDKKLAVSQDSAIINEICEVAKEHEIAVSFGFIEKDGDCFYSSQITINNIGEVIDIYRRVSEGWKLPHANEKYCEGHGFHTFSYLGKEIAVGLCGDFWFDENIDEVKRLLPDVVFWPVYTDYNYNEWNTSVKYEYAEQAGMIGGKVLYVNSVCVDKDEDEIARGGAALFADGEISREIPSGKEDILLVTI
ncbi:MAG: carbon-nitrogen hydrolase family protein [Lachnospiraceae bacterium]|nr:carbon-nitrogen hydrolase family protein [Lachnospiraceae bacterium]